MTHFEFGLAIFFIVIVGYFILCTLFIFFQFIIEDGGILDRCKSKLHEWRE